jgi:hypothetical protein
VPDGNGPAARTFPRKRADARRNEQALLDAAAAAAEIRPGTDAFGLLYAVGNLCAGGDGDPRYDPRRMVGLLIAGLRQPEAACPPVN